MKDYDIRELLKRTELLEFISDPLSKVVPELDIPIAGARIDIAVINGYFHGFEIKSAVDTLQRLPYQLEAYTKVFDYLSVVTENNHYKNLYPLLPKWVGIYVCNKTKGTEIIREKRKPKLNKNKEGFYIAQLLWREEIINVLTENKVPFRKKDRNWILCEILAKEIEIEKLSDIVRGKLKSRKGWRIREGYATM